MTIPVTVEKYRKSSGRLRLLLDGIGQLSPMHQKTISELVAVRLAVALENCISQSLYRVAAGKPMCSGRVASLNVVPFGQKLAQSAVRTGCSKEGNIRSWLDSSELTARMIHIVHEDDMILSRIRAHGGTFADLRKIRNHIAHGNRVSFTGFQQIVLRVYGAKLNHVTPGMLLLTKRAKPINYCRRLIVSSDSAVREIFEYNSAV